MDREIYRTWKNYKGLALFQNALDSWIDHARPKEYSYVHKEKDFDSIYNDLDGLKEVSKEHEVFISVGYSRQTFFPANFNLVKEKEGFIKIMRTPGDVAEKEYIRLRPKKLIAHLTPILSQNCALLSSDNVDALFKPGNDFCVEHNEIYAPFEKSSLFDSYNLVYNISKQNTPILIFPKGSDFIDKKKRNYILREFWSDIKN